MGNIPKLQGWTWLLPHPRPLILRIPHPRALPYMYNAAAILLTCVSVNNIIYLQLLSTYLPSFNLLTCGHPWFLLSFNVGHKTFFSHLFWFQISFFSTEILCLPDLGVKFSLKKVTVSCMLALKFDMSNGIRKEHQH
jgi:hypothetical protein